MFKNVFLWEEYNVYGVNIFMKPIWFVVFSLIFIAMGHAQIVGGYAADFMDYGVGGRELAMGGAGRTSAFDASAGYWNSALLASQKGLSIASMYTTLLVESKYLHFGISSPYMDGVVAFNTVYVGVDNVERHTNVLQPSAIPDNYFGASSGLYILSYAKKISSTFNLGVSAKYGFRNIDTSQDGVLAIDVSFMADGSWIQVGGNLRNIYARKRGDPTDDDFGIDADVGANIRMGNWLICLDLARFLRDGARYYLGTEYTAFEWSRNFAVLLRAGINSNEASAGIGIVVNPLCFDYAFIMALDNSQHRFSINLNIF